MKHNLIVLLLVSLFFSFSIFAFATPITVTMNLAIDPFVLGSPVVQILFFNGPGIISVKAPGTSQSPRITNDWCIGPKVPLGDDLIEIYFPNKKGMYIVQIDIVSVPTTGLDAWIIGADSPALGQNFKILPSGQIQVVSAAPPGLSIQPAMSVRSAGKLATTWGSRKSEVER